MPYLPHAAAFLLDSLGSAHTIRKDADLVGRDARRSAVLGTVPVTVTSNPAWYREAVREGLDGGKLRDALTCVRDGAEPNMRQQEARYIMDRLESARVSGDSQLALDPEHEPKRRGGGSTGTRQARLRVDSGDAVDRVPLRIPRTYLDSLRAQARARGTTLNAYIVGILAKVGEGEEG